MPTSHGYTVFLLATWLAFDLTSRTYCCSPAAVDGPPAVATLKLQLFNKEVRNTVRGKFGFWPFDDSAKCEMSDTRDSGYYHEHHQDEDDSINSLLRAYSRCGITINSWKDRSVDDKSDDEAVNSYVNKTLESGQSNNAANESVAKSHSPRIIGGHLARAGDWPWLAAVGPKAYGAKCGGSLIAEQWVLTAAHCFDEQEQLCKYNVRVGSLNWKYDKHNTHQDRDIAAIYRHPQFNLKDFSNDIALLKLSMPVELDENSYINAVCLPERSRSAEVGTKCMAAGWGTVAIGSGSKILDAREVELPVLTYTDRCGAYRNGTMKEGTVCAGYTDGGRDTCQGDSGGPLVYQDRKQWTLLGVTSWGNGCAKEGYPGIYAEVGHYLHWIASVVERYSDN